MTDLADKIVSALFDLADSDGGLVKSRAVERVAEVLATVSYISPVSKVEADAYDRAQEAKSEEFLRKILTPVTKQYFFELDAAAKRAAAEGFYTFRRDTEKT